MNRTSEQHILLNRWAQQGSDQFITKVRSRWHVNVEGRTFSCKTKTEAREQVFKTVSLITSPGYDI